MISNLIYAYQALNGGYIGIPYNKLDCQAFVEKVLEDCGIKKDWRGSNDMWRNALSWRGTVDECKAKFGGIVPLGTWLFTVRHDGGEVERGYHDNMGNAAHVGIRIQDGAIHSTTGGVQLCAFPASRWTHCGLCKYISFDGYNTGAKDKVLENLNSIETMLKEIRKLMEGWKN